MPDNSPTTTEAYYQVRFDAFDETAEILPAFLSDYAFDTFEENTEGLFAYIPVRDWTDEVEQVVASLSEEYGVSWKRETIEAKNWNEEWERNFEPERIDDFLGIRASFHPPFEGVQYEMVITPKMSFGTGHHPTTRLMVRMMADRKWENLNVLDYGTGTGVLAILAHFMGAKPVLAIDYDRWSYENTIENIEVNNTADIEVRLGGLEALKPEEQFDGILANINRHVLLDSLPLLKKHLKPNACLLLSGIMLKDEDIMRETAAQHGYTVVAMHTEGEWIGLALIDLT